MVNKLPPKLLKELRGVYAVILNELWSRKWVTSSRLLKLTNQKYFDRRVRELRDEYGFDISSKNKAGEWSYLLVSKKRKFTNKRRQYLGSNDRKLILLRDKLKCQICGYVSPSGGLKGFLQFDHKIPFNERGGETSVENMQLVCTRCNVIKRRACQLCTLTSCNNCPYAYPEKFGQIYVVGLSKKVKEKYESKSKTTGKKVEELVQDDLENLN